MYMVVYRVLSIYRVLPGFQEFAVFEKINQFFYTFFRWALQRGGQGPDKGPNMNYEARLYIVRYTYIYIYI